MKTTGWTVIIRAHLSVRRLYEEFAAADEGGRRDGVADVRLPLRDHALDPDALDGAVPAGEVDVGAVGSRGVDRAVRAAAPQALAVRGADGCAPPATLPCRNSASSA